MALRDSLYYRGKRVSRAHKLVLSAYEWQHGPVQLNQGRRTLAEQWVFWRNYLRYGKPLAAYPSPAAPHIKWGRANHALDINAGPNPGQAQHVQRFYLNHHVLAKFNVPGEPWHMDVLEEKPLYVAAERLRPDPVPLIKPGARGKKVLRLKKVMWAKGIRKYKRSTPVYGPSAVDGIKRFQKKHGLKADGIVGQKTWQELLK